MRHFYVCCVPKLVVNYAGAICKATVGYRYRYPTGVNTTILRLLYIRVVYDFKNCRKIFIYLRLSASKSAWHLRIKINKFFRENMVPNIFSLDHFLKNSNIFWKNWKKLFFFFFKRWYNRFLWEGCILGQKWIQLGNKIKVFLLFSNFLEKKKTYFPMKAWKRGFWRKISNNCVGEGVLYVKNKYYFFL